MKEIQKKKKRKRKKKIIFHFPVQIKSMVNCAKNDINFGHVFLYTYMHTYTHSKRLIKSHVSFASVAFG